MTTKRTASAVFALAWVALCLAASPAAAQWQIDSKDGKASIKVGFLAQVQGELLETSDASSWSKNLFVRRFRVLLGGKVADKWLFFFETDSPNVGKANPDKAANPSGAKDAGDVFIQDMFITYDHSAAFKVDAGMILLPISRNHQQSAATLLPIDYGPYSFSESGPVGERVGRDYGLQLRGYPAKQKLEYRVGVFQGLRGAEAKNPLRVVGRVVFYPFGADTGFFYAGTWQGTRKHVAIGGSVDRQSDLRIYSGDVFVEHPIAGGRAGVTFQAGLTHFDGAQVTAALAEQNTWLVEAGLHLGQGRWSPFAQYAVRDFEADHLKDQSIVSGGLAWWLKGHQRAIKASVGRIHTDGQQDRVQVLVQLQVFYY